MASNGRVSGTSAPEVDADYVAAVAGAKQDVEALLEQAKCVPLLLRLAYHDAMTYDHNTKTGGANGSIRVQRELDHAGNESLNSALELLEPIKAKYPVLTYAGGFVQQPALPQSMLNLLRNSETSQYFDCRPVSAVRDFGYKSCRRAIHQLHPW